MYQAMAVWTDYFNIVFYIFAIIFAWNYPMYITGAGPSTDLTVRPIEFVNKSVFYTTLSGCYLVGWVCSMFVAYRFCSTSTS